MYQSNRGSRMDQPSGVAGSCQRSPMNRRVHTTSVRTRGLPVRVLFEQHEDVFVPVFEPADA